MRRYTGPSSTAIVVTRCGAATTPPAANTGPRSIGAVHVIARSHAPAGSRGSGPTASRNNRSARDHVADSMWVAQWLTTATLANECDGPRG